VKLEIRLGSGLDLIFGIWEWNPSRARPRVAIKSFGGRETPHTRKLHSIQSALGCQCDIVIVFVVVFKQQVLIESENGVEPREKRPYHPLLVLLEFEIVYPKECIVHVSEHSCNNTLQSI